MIRLPLVDLNRQHRGLEQEIREALTRVVEAGEFVGGSIVADFESSFASFVGTSLCVGVGNGTDAIHLALRAAGIGTGDEVIVPVNSFVATAEAVSMTGACPVFVDADPNTLQLDVQAMEAAVSRRTAGIVPVHLFGHPADMSAVMSTAARHKLFVCEDAAQAHGATWNGRAVGTIGDAGAFSFYPAKNLGALGDAGAVVTAVPAIAELVRSMSDHGRSDDRDQHRFNGFNSRMHAIQASVLRVKLEHLAEWNDKRRAVASLYEEALCSLPITLPWSAPEAVPVFHLYVIRTPDRDRVRSTLRKNGVGTGVHYPVPIHLQPAYAGEHATGEFPVAERAAGEVLSLPMFPEMTTSDVDFVATNLAASLR